MGSSFRCHWALHELGLAYEQGAVDMSKGEHKSDWYLKLNPAGQVPTLVHDGFALGESLAINAYLCELAGSDLAGAGATERAEVSRWSLYMLTTVQPLLSTLASYHWTGAHDVAAEEKARAALPARLQVLEDRLAASAFLAGARFTLADINVGSAMQYAVLGDVSLEAYPRLAAWVATLCARPAYVAAKG